MSSETGKDKQRAHGTLEGTNHAVHTVPGQKTLSTDYTVPYSPACQVISHNTDRCCNERPYDPNDAKPRILLYAGYSIYMDATM